MILQNTIREINSTKKIFIILGVIVLASSLFFRQQADGQYINLLLGLLELVIPLIICIKYIRYDSFISGKEAKSSISDTDIILSYFIVGCFWILLSTIYMHVISKIIYTDDVHDILYIFIQCLVLPFCHLLRGIFSITVGKGFTLGKKNIIMMIVVFMVLRRIEGFILVIFASTFDILTNGLMIILAVLCFVFYLFGSIMICKKRKNKNGTELE